MVIVGALLFSGSLIAFILARPVSKPVKLIAVLVVFGLLPIGLSIALGPPLFYWQPPYQIPNTIFLVLPFLAYLLTRALMTRQTQLQQTPGLREKYRGSQVSPEYLDRLDARLNKLVHQDEVYLQPDLTLTGLALLTGTDTHTISRLINERYGMNFFNYINSHRIRAFIQLVSQESSKKKTYLSLAHAVGFRNKTSFNAAFKRHTQKTPTEYFR